MKKRIKTLLDGIIASQTVEIAYLNLLLDKHKEIISCQFTIIEALQTAKEIDEKRFGRIHAAAVELKKQLSPNLFLCNPVIELQLDNIIFDSNQEEWTKKPPHGTESTEHIDKCARIDYDAFMRK